jgi:hypothetical protein
MSGDMGGCEEAGDPLNGDVVVIDGLESWFGLFWFYVEIFLLAAGVLNLLPSLSTLIYFMGRRLVIHNTTGRIFSRQNSNNVTTKQIIDDEESFISLPLIQPFFLAYL